MSLLAKTAALLRPRVAVRQTGPIGIDFSLESLHLVQLQADSGQRPSVRARASVTFDGPRQDILKSRMLFRTLFKRALGSGDFHGRKAVIAIPSGMFRTMSVNYQSSAGEGREAAAIVGAMNKRLDGDLSDYVIDYLPVRNRSKGDERLALVAVSERQPVIELLELARGAGLDVQALEIGPVAISRLVGALSLQSGSGNCLVINSGRRASYLTLISGSDVLFDQEVAFGESSLIRQVADTLDMNEALARDLVVKTGVRSDIPPRVDGTAVESAIEESGLIATMSEILKPQFMQIVEEIKRVCLYAAAETRGGAVGQIYLLGSIARWPGSGALLSSLTGTQVSKISDPLASFRNASDESISPSATTPEIVVATGAALRGMQEHG